MTLAPFVYFLPLKAIVLGKKILFIRIFLNLIELSKIRRKLHLSILPQVEGEGVVREM